MNRNILDAVKVVRSKNAGPFELTLDMMFLNRRYFDLFRKKRLLTPRVISKLYGMDSKDILNIIYFEPCLAVKITMRRWIPSGSAGESDVYGAQQHGPLLTLMFNDDKNQ